MKLITRLCVAVVLLVIGGTATANWTSSTASGVGQRPNRPGGVVILRPGDMQWTDYPNRPGVKLAMIEGDLTKPGPFMMRVRFPAGYKLAPHTHPGIEHTTVLSGALRVGYGTKDDGPSDVLPAGSVIVTPPNTPHFVSTTQETIVQTHGIGPWSSMPVK
jgi:quercetin dioxygenase-like cupin family protein